MKINIKDSTYKESKYELGTLYKDETGDVFYFVQVVNYFGVNYLTLGGHLADNVGIIGLHCQSIQEASKCITSIPETPIPAKELYIKF